MTTATTEKVDDRFLVTTRVIDAPRELVFDAWSDPRALSEWFGPNGFTTTTTKFDMRPGGEWLFTMHGPDGTDYPNRIRFDEIVRPEKLAFRHDDGAENPSIEFKNVVTFEELGGKTVIVMRAEFATQAALDTVIREHHADEGGRQTMGRLAAFAEGRAKRPPKDKPVRTAVVVRTFDAPRALVWKAWTDPQALAAWWGPRDFTVPVCELDVRPGGRLRIDMQGPGGVNRLTGTFEAVVEPERLSFHTQAFEDEQGVPQLQGYTAITLTEHDGRTTLVLEAVVVKAAPWIAEAINGSKGMHRGMEEGWSQSIDKLEELLLSSAEEERIESLGAIAP